MQYELREIQQRVWELLSSLSRMIKKRLGPGLIGSMSWMMGLSNKNGSPEDIYDEPINHFVADLVNLIF